MSENANANLAANSVGGAGSSIANGGAGNSVANGSAGSSLANGGAGNSVANGSAGSSLANGSVGSNMANGGSGSSMANGGAGKKKVTFSAIKPTGSMTLGNYVGAIKNWVDMQQRGESDCFYCVADMHSITVDVNPAEFRQNTIDDLALFLAFGLDENKSTLFLQSHVPAHAELCWLLNCYTQFGEAKRMTQFKDKSKKTPDNINVGLFDYPVLMAADILLYQADYVPVGQDQKQHVELARTIAQRFNNRYSPTFVMPEPIIPKHGAKIYSLAEPTVKMSKSDSNPNGYVLLLENPLDIERKFKRAVTDSDTKVRYSAKEKPGISNLLVIYSCFAGVSLAAAEKEFAESDYATFKARVGQAVASFLSPVQQRYKKIVADKGYLSQVLKLGADKAAYAASKMLSKVYRKIGFLGKNF